LSEASEAPEPRTPPAPAPHPIDHPTERSRTVSAAGALLAVGWLTVPAIQYFATLERSRYLPGESGDPDNIPAIVQFEITYPYYYILVVAYLVLVLLTLVHVFRSTLARRSDRELLMNDDRLEMTGGTA
jgi:hypothetical protein